MRENILEEEEQVIDRLIRAAVRMVAYPAGSKQRGGARSSVYYFGKKLIEFGYTGDYKIEPEMETFPIVPTPGTIERSDREPSTRFGNDREEASIVPDVP